MRSLPLVILATCLMVCSIGSFCQVPQASSLEVSAPEHELDVMTKRYRLESSQRNEIKTILESRAEDLQSISNDPRLSPDQREHRFKDVRRIGNREIEAVLHNRQRMLFDQGQK
jgi:hypothetical protein